MTDEAKREQLTAGQMSSRCLCDDCHTLTEMTFDTDRCHANPVHAEWRGRENARHSLIPLSVERERMVDWYFI